MQVNEEELNMTETKKMLEIIHKNQKKVREFNIKRAKARKRQMIVDNVFMFLGSSIFLIGLMTFIAVIESMRF